MKIKLLFQILVATCFFSTVNAQQFTWAKSLTADLSTENPSFLDSGNAIAVDGDGNVYIAGIFTGTSDFDPGTGTAVMTSAGDLDIYITKLNASGNFVWSKQIGGPAADRAESMVIDNDGNIFLAGFFSGSTDFNPGAGVATLSSAGDSDVFYAKLDADGNYIWAKRIGGTGEEWATDIELDQDGNIYVAGHFSASCDFDSGAAVFNLTAMGQEDFFICKMTNTGNFVWVRSGGSAGVEGIGSLSIDNEGTIYACGSFQQTVDFDPGIGSFNMTSSGDQDIFILKFSGAGDFIWAKQIGGTGIDLATELIRDTNGNIYTTGAFSNTADFDPSESTYNLTAPGGMGIFISKLNSDGNFVWAKAMTGTLSSAAFGITLDNSGNIYSTGWFFGTCDFDPGAEEYELTVQDVTSDIFVSKLTSDGNFVWAQQIGGGFSATENGRDILHDGLGNLFVTGNFVGTADFDAGSETQNLTTIAGKESFIYKMQDGSLRTTDYDVEVVALYPNPAANFTNIRNAPINTEITIMDLSGKIVGGAMVTAAVSLIDTDGLENGVYIVQLTYNGQKSYKKLIINK